MISTYYWNNQKNSLTERIDYFTDNKESEIILVLNNNEEKEISEILRIIRNEDILVPIYHGLITDNKDGYQTENRII